MYASFYKDYSNISGMANICTNNAKIMLFVGKCNKSKFNSSKTEFDNSVTLSIQTSSLRINADMKVIIYVLLNLIYLCFDCMASTAVIMPLIKPAIQNRVNTNKPSTISFPKSPNSHRAINCNSNRIIEESSDNNYSNNNFNNLFKDLADYDNLNNSDDVIHNVYQSIVGILILRIQNWLTNTKVELFSYYEYLGFQKETIHLINSSITKLFYLQNRGKIQIYNLIDVFFYSCDIGNYINRNQTEQAVAEVKDNLSLMLNKLKANYLSNDIEINDEKVLVEEIKSSMALIVEKVKPSLSIAIPLMKNRVYVNYSRQSDLNKDDFIKKNQDFVEATKYETDGKLITTNHVSLLQKIIPDIFGFAYNHLELLTELRRFELDISDLNKIKSFSNLLSQFQDIFLTRFFEFKYKREINQKLKQSLEKLIDFLSFKDLENTLPKFSCDNTMWTLMDDVLERLLFYTNEYDSIEAWKNNRTMKIIYEKDSNYNVYYLKLIELNSEDFNDILETFYSHFEL